MLLTKSCRKAKGAIWPRVYKAFSTLVLTLYPALIYFSLKYLDAYIVICICLLSLFITFYGYKKVILENKQKASLIVIAAFLIFFFGNIIYEINYVLLYPVLINTLLLVIFSFSLLPHKTPIVERIAKLKDGHLTASGASYTRKVTILWALFFLFNGSVSFYTALSKNIELWALYNSFISYIFIGTIFSAEFIIRQIVKNKWKKNC